MKKRLLTIKLTIFFSLKLMVCIAHSAELQIERTITEVDGLASDVILTVFEDSQGRMWFGTINGVTRYTDDGFRTFTTEDGLASDAVGLIFQDRHGALWFGSGTTEFWSGGVSQYDDGEFRTFSMDNGLADNSIRDIFEDKTETLWFATGYGISKFDGERFSNIIVDGPMGKNVLPEWWNDVRAIVEDTAGNLWFASDAGISHYNVKTSSFRYFGIGEDFAPFQKMENAETGHITDLQFDVNGNLWMSQDQSWGEHSGIRRYDGKQLLTFPHSKEIPMNGVNNIMQDSKGNLWFAAGPRKLQSMPRQTGDMDDHDTGPGVSVYNGRTFQNFNVANGLPSDIVRSVFEAKDGRLWFSTTKGVAIGVYVPSQD